ncbi:DUF202 domain-containing protein [Embleya hyalina]|uniref:DUF202 domain-containing protein n=1 Tax=Embleya hyalina TaxID=516124 RepID=A0A401Z4L2_9ACTN|nr:DUF202 domain-containing protein [Embleya hyalina]GCE01775.1 hypothetical protein EHYA_09549 [Embleya hyalina]
MARTVPLPGAPLDPGLQPERTRMAWSRTSLAFVANGALLVRAGHVPGRWWFMLPGFAVMAAGFGVYVVGLLRHRQVDHAVRGGGAAVGDRAIRATLLTVLAACVLAAVVLVGRP